ncbi:N-acetylmuramic acid 6-phosphate etherase [Mycoplasmopsis californica]|uniref:N-acetylmuramic acid 6-phosphate etherase n=1 Tax=Mycoplasmopsis equigenitalium TaxID=114883 RepID=A0ABY5J4P0_9BACT|nr:N-acetylmuramic acid 6-phosphate etherase [Mycoplasmopsis equigenitalium]UUD36668.1 N-acetylmuramic acid 6-phosphate etherase [Mycoplasmopsis equigenitalium]VEU69370.1 N-acetylmuramic acid 6-phosphate etherase [Mycoplasmopsis californica]
MSENTIDELETEKRNVRTKNLSSSSALEIVEMINNEDRMVADAVLAKKHNIARVIDIAYDCLKNKKGRIIYLGAGTSGRIGILDATEIWPTFGVKNKVIGLIAGGKKALFEAVEKAEDNTEFAIEDLKKVNLNANDIVIGITASGRTPYVLSGLKFAKSINAKTALICNSSQKQKHDFIDEIICITTGAEAIAGSTRMKAGTSQKMVCNMISSAVMTKLGYVESNYMINLIPTNYKLEQRCKNIIKTLTHAPNEQIETYFNLTKNVKMTLLMIQYNISKEKAEKIYKELYE